MKMAKTFDGFSITLCSKYIEYGRNFKGGGGGGGGFPLLIGVGRGHSPLVAHTIWARTRKLVVS